MQQTMSKSLMKREYRLSNAKSIMLVLSVFALSIPYFLKCPFCHLPGLLLFRISDGLAEKYALVGT